ncbi:MAG: glycosyltransferase [Candidatus Eremiobacteraeota bacterium]|nr:glycosyltransferase [Candidatus Eremiobacteraeota bacterium]
MNQRGGAERVFAHIARAYPEAPIYTALFDESAVGEFIDGERVRASWLAHLPGVNRYFRTLAPLYPGVFERFDLREYDTIVSSTTAWAKGVRFAAGAKHVCYINTVSRFAFAYDAYVDGNAVRSLAQPLVKRLVEWDRVAAMRPTAYIANSRNVADRIKRYYGRDSYVLHCPVDVDRFALGPGSGDYAFVASRLLSYKRIDLAIRACALVKMPLLIAGTGPAEAALRRLARGSGATLLGYVPDAQLNQLMGDARVVIVPGEEDFGLVPLEAAATGRPVIAYRGGGALETVRDGETGRFFDAQTPEALAAALRDFAPEDYDPAVLRAHAEQFAPAAFIARFQHIVEEVRP